MATSKSRLSFMEKIDILSGQLALSKHRYEQVFEYWRLIRSVQLVLPYTVRLLDSSEMNGVPPATSTMSLMP